MVPESSWSPQLRRALEYCFGKDFDFDQIKVERWHRPFSSKESFKINYRDYKLAAVHHRPADGNGGGMIQLYVRVLGQLWAINTLADVEESTINAQRALLQATGGGLAIALLLIALTATGIGNEQISVTLSL